MEIEDDALAVYSYAGSNWNLGSEDSRRLEAIPGSFTISKAALEEPRIRLVRKRVSKHHKQVVEKRIPHFPDTHRHLADGGIVLDEPCGVDSLEDTGDGRLPRIADILIVRVYLHYMKDGALPKEESFLQ